MKQPTRVGMQRGVFELVGVHFAQAFEAADGIRRFAHVFLFQAFEDGVEFGFIQRVKFAGGLGFALRVHIHAEQRRLGNINMPVGDEFGEMAVKQREQQHLDVRAVHVRIRQNGDFAVAQAAQIHIVVRAVRVHADSDGNIVDFGIAEKLVAVHFKAVEHFAAQGQDGLVTFIARQFGRAARAVAFHQKQFVFADIFAFAVGQFTGQNCHTTAFFLLDFFHGTHPCLRLLNRQIRNFFADFGVLVEPQFQRVAAHGGHEFERVAVGELVFGLPLELRVEHAGGEHEGGSGEHVVAVDFHAAR